MIYLPEYPLIPNRFPADKCFIITHVRLKDVVGDCRPDQLDSLPPELRPLVHHKKNEAKADFITAFARSPSKKYNPTIPTCVIFIGSFHGIKLHAEKDPGIGWVIYMITFNPGGVCNGHNGWVTQDEHFIHACSDLVELVAPLLEQPDDSVHLIPGLHPDSDAWWKSLEIPFQILDPSGSIFRAFTNAKHPEINNKPLYLCQDESIAFSNSIGDLVIRVYRKDLEMRKKKRKQVTSDTPVLRIEVQLSGAKMDEHFKGGVWKVIDGKRCLVSFRAANLRAAFLSVMSKFSGVFSEPSSVVGQNENIIGRMIGWVAKMTDLSVEDQIAYYAARFQTGNTPGTVKNAKSTMRKAARKELALQSTVSLSDLFSEDAWHYPPAVVCSKVESMVGGRHMEVTNHPLVEAAYGTRHQTIHPSYGSRANS